MERDLNIILFGNYIKNLLFKLDIEKHDIELHLLLHIAHKISIDSHSNMVNLIN